MSRYDLTPASALDMLIQFADLSDDRTSEPKWINTAISQIILARQAEIAADPANPANVPPVDELEELKAFVVQVMMQNTKHAYRAAALQGLLASGQPTDRVNLNMKAVTMADKIYMDFVDKLMVGQTATPVTTGG